MNTESVLETKKRLLELKIFERLKCISQNELLSFLTAFNERREELYNTNEWVSVKEKLPSEGKEVLVNFSDGIPVQAYYNHIHGKWFASLELRERFKDLRSFDPELLNQDFITHWTDLPFANNHF